MILSALNSRMERQGGLITKAEVYEFVFATQEDVEAFLALAKVADSISFLRLVVLTLIIFHIIFHIVILIIFSQGCKSPAPLAKKAGQCLQRLSDCSPP